LNGGEGFPDGEAEIVDCLKVFLFLVAVRIHWWILYIVFEVVVVLCLCGLVEVWFDVISALGFVCDL